jgi:hypothetical protein
MEALAVLGAPELVCWPTMETSLRMISAGLL